MTHRRMKGEMFRLVTLGKANIYLMGVAVGEKRKI